MSVVHDRVELASLLGLRFVDVSTGQVVRSGLDIQLYLPGRPWRRSRAHAAGSGCWVPFDLAALGLPDVGEAERAGVGSEAWMRLVQRALKLRVEVTDSARRFLPSRFEAPLPSVVAAPAARFEDSLPLPLPLYSAPWRRPGAALLSLRAELLDRASREPLVGAWVSVHLDASTLAGQPSLASGIADAKGHVLLLLHQPVRAAAPPPGASSAGASPSTSVHLTLRHRALPIGADLSWTDVAERESQALLPARHGIATAAVAAANDVPLGAIALKRGTPQVLRTKLMGVDALGQPTTTTLPSLLVAAA